MADNIRRPATESLLHTKSVAEGLFDVSRSSGGRGSPGTSPFDVYASKMDRVPGRSPDDPTRSPDAFDVGTRVALEPVLSKEANTLRQVQLRVKSRMALL